MRFVIGMVCGALLTYGAIVYGPSWVGSGDRWLDEAASGYRGDRRHSDAEEALR